MSDGVLGVPPEELARVSRLIASTAASLSAELGALDSEVSEFVGSGWHGGSASAFAQQWVKFHEGAKLVNQGLSQMSSLLVSNKDAFENRDAANAASVDAAGA
ncbi:WXG100 family type VII secretion target [Mycobacteroides abscessus]|uniref:WXG100 family type VII secretion target n=1 Tax=Mycobacteroides abscessus TaxID=36809 RepID=UPI0005E25189|nr:WXG100 family type VII secretion target [Mycobacteroides abscessus]MBN7319252.1 WXG100 family type VII secretion target [Mycobacteroides abscessus subsp. massiliense]MDO3200910.1 WXG100 family type VII secretion target [Mycobacteroides abscessus subsp. abscessus]CPU64499.1 WXG100 family type VII secretion target [Mycobacteroides abscessus]CPX45151.1 WXG100 family type VII secretion target [Mycobacteroides abscessus]CPZ60294.1 WXG100 family type VII secretion target [Mycobacteroides abscessu